MWIVAEKGFYSVVQHKANSNILLVRARVRKDLERLREYVPYLKVVNDTEGLADYKYRAYVIRSDFAKAMRKMILDIDYPNFKSRIKARYGYEREFIYFNVWIILMDLCARLPFWQGRRKSDQVRSISDNFWDDDAGKVTLSEDDPFDESVFLDAEYGRLQKWLHEHPM